MQQRTIAEKVSCTGIGLHSGAPVQLTLHPARAGHGVRFVRTDLPVPVEIPARPGYVTATRLATTIGRGRVHVSTVEHLLAALYGLGVDNVRIEVDGPEVPVMDGSAASFVCLLRMAGLFDQAAARNVRHVRRPIELRDGERWIRVEPASRLIVSYAVDFEHPVIGRQAIHDLTIDAETFEHELARARTFGFLRDVQALWKAGLARGGSLDNTVVLDERRVLNGDGLRFDDEFVRHKALDLVGDIAMLGVALNAHVRVSRGGHALHQALLKRLARELLDARPDARRSASRWGNHSGIGESAAAAPASG